MSEVELVIHTVAHLGESSAVDGDELVPRLFPSIDVAKAAADELPVPDGWQRKESIRDAATGAEICWRTDRLPGWTAAAP
jgi:hypothetical protein